VHVKCIDLYITSKSKHISDIKLNEFKYPNLFKSIKSKRIIKSINTDKNDLTHELLDDYLKPNNISSILIASVIFKGKVIGMVSFEHTGKSRQWEEDETGFAVILADQVTRIISDEENYRLESQLMQSQKMEILGTLAGGIAHDFNNVLGGIVGTLSLLQYKYKKIKENELKNFIETMMGASERASDLCKQLLTVARKQKIKLTPLDINLSVKNVIKLSKNIFEKIVDIKINHSAEPAMVNADPTQIEQVLLNLCLNGYQAMTIMRNDKEEQGGTLSIDVKNFYADEFFCTTHPRASIGDYWVFSISDTGVGMDKETSDKIFDPLFSTKKDKGTGLGLTMVYNIIQQHKGFIDLYSEPEYGTIFKVYIPALDISDSVESKEKEEKIRKGEGLILVVDDEAMIRNIAKEILQECGYKVILAEDGDEGVALFKEKHKEIAAVILDMAMPKKTGKEAYIEMKKIDKNLKAVIVSGYLTKERLDEMKKLGAKGFLTKPYTLKSISEMIYKTINNNI